jgi:hypothetical protein
MDFIEENNHLQQKDQWYGIDNFHYGIMYPVILK